MSIERCENHGRYDTDDHLEGCPRCVVETKRFTVTEHQLIRDTWTGSVIANCHNAVSAQLVANALNAYGGA